MCISLQLKAEVHKKKKSEKPQRDLEIRSVCIFTHFQDVVWVDI